METPKKKITFTDCLYAAINNAEFVSGFNRLTGNTLGEDNRSPIDRMVDSATGYDKEISEEDVSNMAKFTAFVWEVVWTRLPLEVRE